MYADGGGVHGTLCCMTSSLLQVPGYVLGDVLGEGRHGVVRKAVHVDSGVTVAIKIIATTGADHTDGEVLAVKAQRTSGG